MVQNSLQEICLNPEVQFEVADCLSVVEIFEFGAKLHLQLDLSAHGSKRSGEEGGDDKKVTGLYRQQ